MEIKYYSTSYSADEKTIKDRISFYLEMDNFEIDLDDCVNLIFPSDLSKEEYLKVDLSMASIGYLRY